MDPFSMSVALGLLQGAKSEFIDTPQARKRAEADAVQTQYSPWTGFGKGKDFQAPDVIGNVLGGAISGYELGQRAQAFEANKKLANSWSKALEAEAKAVDPTPQGYSAADAAQKSLDISSGAEEATPPLDASNPTPEMTNAWNAQKMIDSGKKRHLEDRRIQNRYNYY